MPIVRKWYETILNTRGEPASGVNVTVYTANTQNKATLYDTVEGTSHATNPATTDGGGYVEFYIPPGTYDLVLSGSGFQSRTIQDVFIPDVAAEADDVGFTPTADVSATDAQSAIAEVGSGLAGHIADADAAHASSAISFTASGTGAVTRTAQDKLREVVSVKDFGAVGDGVTDDTAAIQKAVDAAYVAGGGDVWLTGVHIVSDEIDWKEGVNIRGRGWRMNGVDYSTVYGTGFKLKATAGLGAGKGVIRAKCTSPEAGRRHMGRMTDLFIHGNGDTNAGTHGLVVDARNVFIEGCNILRCSGKAIRESTATGTPNGTHLLNSYVRFNYDDGLYLLGGEHSVTGCYIGNNGGSGIFSSAGSVTIVGNTFADNTSDGIYLQDTRGSVITGNLIQDNYRNGVQIDSSGLDVEYVTITGNSIYDNGLDDSNDANNRCGIKLAAGKLQHSTVSGNSIGNRRKAGDIEHPDVSPSQQYGVYFVSTATRVEWSGNEVSQNVIEDVHRAALKNIGLSFRGDGDDNRLSEFIDAKSYAPTLKFGGSDTGIVYSTQSASYSRVGNMVFVSGVIILSAKGSATGDATIDLPDEFLAASYAAANIRANSLASGVGTAHLQGLVNSGGTAIILGRLTGGSNLNMTDADFGNSSSLMFSVMYRVG